jgi:hypothetical protein
LLNPRNLQSLSQFFGINESLLNDVSQPLPVELVRERLFQGPRVLPETYAHNASSFVRSSAHIVEYLTLTRGRRFTDRLLIDMNIHPLIFDDIRNRINLQFLIDLLNKLRLAGMAEREIESLGCYVFLRNQDTEMGRHFAQARDYRECYEVLSNYIFTFDTNFDYRIEVDAREMRLYATPTEGEAFIAGKLASNFYLVARQKCKAIGWFPVLSNLAPVNLETPKCVARGDSYSLYRFRFSSVSSIRPNYLRLLTHS